MIIRVKKHAALINKECIIEINSNYGILAIQKFTG